MSRFPDLFHKSHRLIVSLRNLILIINYREYPPSMCHFLEKPILPTCHATATWNKYIKVCRWKVYIWKPLYVTEATAELEVSEALKFYIKNQIFINKIPNTICPNISFRFIDQWPAPILCRHKLCPGKSTLVSSISQFKFDIDSDFPFLFFLFIYSFPFVWQHFMAHQILYKV